MSAFHGDKDQDWLALDGTAPSSTSQDIYTMGSVGIGSNSPGATLSIKGSDSDCSTKAFDIKNSSDSVIFSFLNNGSAVLHGSTLSAFRSGGVLGRVIRASGGEESILNAASGQGLIQIDTPIPVVTTGSGQRINMDIRVGTDDFFQIFNIRYGVSSSGDGGLLIGTATEPTASNKMVPGTGITKRVRVGRNSNGNVCILVGDEADDLGVRANVFIDNIYAQLTTNYFKEFICGDFKISNTSEASTDFTPLTSGGGYLPQDISL